MLYTWFYLFNFDEHVALDLTSKSYELILEGIGQKTILVTQGNCLSVLYEGVFLPLELNGANPFEFDGHAVYKDPNSNVWLGVAIAD